MTSRGSTFLAMCTDPSGTFDGGTEDIDGMVCADTGSAFVDAGPGGSGSF